MAVGFMSQILSEQVFTVDELARAAGVAPRDVAARLAAGEIRPVSGTCFITTTEAIRAGRMLRAAAAARPHAAMSLFAAVGSGSGEAERRGGLPAVVSSAFHAALVA